MVELNTTISIIIIIITNKLIINAFFLKFQNTFGPASSLNNQNFLISKPDFKLVPGDVLRVKFTIKFNPEKAIPNVVGIKINGFEICASDVPKVTDYGSNNVVNSTNIVNSNNVVNSANIVIPPKVTSTPSPDKTVVELDTDDGMCGIKAQARALVYNGQKVEGRMLSFLNPFSIYSIEVQHFFLFSTLALAYCHNEITGRKMGLSLRRISHNKKKCSYSSTLCHSFAYSQTNRYEYVGFILR